MKIQLCFKYHFSKSRIIKTSSNSDLVSCVNFPTMPLRKASVHFLFISQLWIKLGRLGYLVLNSIREGKSRTVEKATENHFTLLPSKNSPKIKERNFRRNMIAYVLVLKKIKQTCLLNNGTMYFSVAV